MAAEKVECPSCGADFLKTTAERTDGKCLACYKGTRNGAAYRREIAEKERKEALEEDLEPEVSLRATNSEFLRQKSKSKSDGLPAGCWFALLIFGLFIWKPVLASVGGLITKFIFQSDWDTAVMVAFVSYLVLGGLFMLMDLIDDTSQIIYDLANEET
ncbi:MAG: hypothetical protein AAF585_00770 [Verrucomicrobiota bacterium]